MVQLFLHGIGLLFMALSLTFDLYQKNSPPGGAMCSFTSHSLFSFAKSCFFLSPSTRSHRCGHLIFLPQVPCCRSSSVAPPGSWSSPAPSRGPRTRTGGVGGSVAARTAGAVTCWCFPGFYGKKTQYGDWRVTSLDTTESTLSPAGRAGRLEAPR